MNNMLEFSRRSLPSGAPGGPVSSSGSILAPEGFDNSIRWRPGLRLQHLFEQRCAVFNDAADSVSRSVALEVDGTTVTFADLDRRANQMARYFSSLGIGAGDRIGLMVDRSIEAYVALIAVLKVDAAYVPLDVKFPTDRIAFIAGDAGIKAFVTTAAARQLVVGLGMPVIELQEAGGAASAFAGDRLEFNGAIPKPDQLCYIIYTSGSTGRPKGVAVNHSSICNFVQVATEVYGYVPGDRVYQGMTLAFDFSVEELWVPLLSGATLVPSPADRHMVGAELAQFLLERRVTAMCCVPTLLATIDIELPELRLLLVSGEACPQDIVVRWQRPGRRMLNAYGPTEATVTATWTEVHSNKAVTIGVPLPTYTIAILETARDALAADGAIGEIAIAGIGLAVGYVNRDDLTAKAFVPDFLQLSNNPSRRLYRTGDLGRINAEGEIEYLGRIDTQVKIRGYRIELSEIENVLLEIQGVSQAVVTTHETEPGLVDLAAYVTLFKDGERPSRERILQVLRSRLPGYMVPAFVEELDTLPLLASHKADRRALPPPSSLRLVSSSGDFVAPRDTMEIAIAECLAETLKLDAISVDDHFFDDLGAHSLIMSQFLAVLSVRLPMVKAAISDVYLAPTVALLASALSKRQAAIKPPAADVVVADDYAAHIASDFDYYSCGALQAAFYALQFFVSFGIAAAGISWTAAAGDGLGLVLRALAVSAGSLAFAMAVPVVAKWALVGRWQAGRIPLWSLRYFKFWAVLQLTMFSPWVAFRGTALFNVYLRLLGARIGEGALLLTERVPLATDLLRIGDRTVLRRMTRLTGYRAEKGFVHIGAIDIGDDVTVGEAALIDLGASIGDGGQLGHASALLSGQSVPAGTRYHGSPAIETDIEFRYLPHRETSLLRRTTYAGMRLLSVVFAGAVALVIAGFGVQWQAEAAPEAGFAVSDTFVNSISMLGVLEVAGFSIVLYAAGFVIALAAHWLVPRLMRMMLVTGKVYPLYGPRYYAAQMLSLFGHAQGFQTLFGDSSAIVHYFNWLGLRQPDVKQTGSNFGTAMGYDSPFDTEIGSGSMISDGFAVVNFEVGSGSFRVAPARLGTSCFVGNSIVFPSNARVGNNVLLGTKVMVPIDGAVRENVGLLGSPAFEIPREVVNDQRFNPVPSTPEEHARLAAKNAFNFRTGLIYFTAQWFLLFGLMVIGWVSSGLYGALGNGAVVVGAALATLFVVAHNILTERLGSVGIEMRAHNCTIHEPYFWWVERHWKFGETMLKYAFRGTPFRPFLLRRLGLKVGRKVFDDGAIIPEMQLVEIGDYCCINSGSALQAHSLEDGLFKSDRICIGDGCTIGPAGFVHYGVQMGAGTVLAADAFLMKGSRTLPASKWLGNPARIV